MRRTALAAGGAAVVVVALLGARAAASDGSTLPAPAWDLLRQFTWPGAVVASLFSPVGKALAGWITAVTPARTASAQDQGIAQALAEISEGVRRSSQVQEETAKTLVKVQQSLAILLDRTPR